MFDHSVLRHSGIWGAEDDAVLNRSTKKSRKNPRKKEFWDLDVKGVSVVEASLRGVCLQGDEGQVTLRQRARAQLHTDNQSFRYRGPNIYKDTKP